MIFEIKNPSTGHVYDNRVPLVKAVDMIAGNREVNEKALVGLREDDELPCRSRHIPSFKLILKKVSLGDLLEGQ